MNKNDLSEAQETLIAVWDLPLRLFHWLLSILVCFLIVTGNIGGDWIIWHIRAAYILSGLVLFRVLWGFFGTYYSRFSSFNFSIFGAARYLRALFSGKSPSFYGHNPAGSIMVLVLLIALATQFLAGTVISDDIIWYGPFYHWVSETLSNFGTSLHHRMEWVLLVLVALHVFAVLYHQIRHKEKIIQAMIHGQKPRQEIPEKQIKYSKPILFFIVVACILWCAWLWRLPI